MVVAPIVCWSPSGCAIIMLGKRALASLLNLAVTCDFQQCGILTSVDSDESVQPPIKLRNSNLMMFDR